MFVFHSIKEAELILMKFGTYTDYDLGWHMGFLYLTLRTLAIDSPALTTLAHPVHWAFQGYLNPVISNLANIIFCNSAFW